MRVLQMDKHIRESLPELRSWSLLDIDEYRMDGDVGIAKTLAIT